MIFCAVIVILFSFYRSQCLNNNTLIAMGLEPVLTPYTPTNITVCKDVLKTSKSCVNLEVLEKLVTAVKTYFLKSEKKSLTESDAEYGSVMSDVHYICNVQITTSNLGKKYNGVVITDSMISICNNFNKLVSNLTFSFDLLAYQNNTEKCYDKVVTMVNGAYCMIASSSALTYITVESNNLIFNVHQNVSNSAFVACGPVILRACLRNEIAALTNNITGQKTASPYITTTCKSSFDANTCINNPTTCSTTFKNALFTMFFEPLGTLVTTSVNMKLKKETSILRQLETKRLLAADNSFYTYYQVSSTGFSVDTIDTGMSTSSNFLALEGLDFSSIFFTFVLFTLILI